MYVDDEECFYYLTVENENYVQPPMPEDEGGGYDGVREGIVRGMYRFSSDGPDGAPYVNLLGSGAILNEVRRAQQVLAEDYGIASHVWSVTSWNELRRDALEVERWNLLHPAEAPRQPYIVQQLGEDPNLVVASTDYLKALPDGIAKWVNAPVVALGTDGFGRSATREELRDFFEVDYRHIVFATLSALVRQEVVPLSVVQEAGRQLEIDTERPNPARV
jgi:pyruvate dehydrogenase E1 component